MIRRKQRRKPYYDDNKTDQNPLQENDIVSSRTILEADHGEMETK